MITQKIKKSGVYNKLHLQNHTNLEEVMNEKFNYLKLKCLWSTQNEKTKQTQKGYNFKFTHATQAEHITNCMKFKGNIHKFLSKDRIYNSYE